MAVAQKIQAAADGPSDRSNGPRKEGRDVGDVPECVSESIDEATPPLTRRDAVRLRQVLLNLLSNAAKFTRKGEVRLEVQRDGARIRVDVSDTGMGMDDEQLGRLFEPFIQVHREGVDTLGGTGLGLAISRRLCRLMGGDLTVRSRRGEGSTFSIWLVAAADTTGHPRA